MVRDQSTSGSDRGGRIVRVYSKEEVDALIAAVTGATYTSTSPVTETIGGIDEGEEFTSASMQDMW